MGEQYFQGEICRECKKPISDRAVRLKLMGSWSYDEDNAFLIYHPECSKLGIPKDLSPDTPHEIKEIVLEKRIN